VTRSNQIESFFGGIFRARLAHKKGVFDSSDIYTGTPFARIEFVQKEGGTDSSEKSSRSNQIESLESNKSSREFSRSTRSRGHTIVTGYPHEVST
jgi:hypothetical protein